MLVFAMVNTVFVHNLSVSSALSLSHSYMTANAISKGQSIGLIGESSNATLKQMLGGSTQPVIRVMSRDIPVVRQRVEGEFRAIDVKALKEKYRKSEMEGMGLLDIPTYSPEGALGYLQRAFGGKLGMVIGACVVVMKSWLEGEGTEEEREERRTELDKQGYGMYCQVRPDVPYGQAVSALVARLIVGMGKEGGVEFGEDFGIKEDGE
jgi:hypothetical protein